MAHCFAQVTSGPHDHAGTPGLRFQRIPHAAVSWLTAAHSQADMLGVSEGAAAVFALVLRSPVNVFGIANVAQAGYPANGANSSPADGGNQLECSE